jgi:hypothetical protein
MPVEDHARLRRLERAFRKGCFSSEAELDALIEAELNKLEPGERERILLGFLREEGLSAGTTDGGHARTTP